MTHDPPFPHSSGACPHHVCSTGKVLRLARLRGFARMVIVAGSKDHIKASLEAMEPYKQDLMERGVMVVPVTIGPEAGAPFEVPEVGSEVFQSRVSGFRLFDILDTAS